MAEADPFRPVTQPLRTADLVRARAIEAVLGQSGLHHPGLAAEVRRRFGSRDVAEGALVREPVIEGAAPFRVDGRSFGDVSGTLLHPAVVDAIASAKDPQYRFDRTIKPYAHQIEAWEHLTAQERRSVLVSSGTGSGKTECFLMPLLHDLATEVEQSGRRLSGVRALALYPLNALIASQEERLRAWTAPFGGKIRFGLYNGLTPETPRNLVPVPEQVLDRQTLRKDPPPILVTNVTMLEYLTVRRVDRPLIENSRGQLRWIILDEAHSYVGSAAAEIALLIRRVLLTFGVSAEQVRFVATSATIGDDREESRKEVTEELRRFLRDLSGADEDRVKPVFGHRQAVSLPEPAATATLSKMDLTDRSALDRNPKVQAFVRAAEAGPVGWVAAQGLLGATDQPAERVLDAIAAPGADTPPLLPLRVHGFLRAVPGLWSCLDPACKGTPQDWPFGQVAVERIDYCPTCRGPVFEILSCRECGEPYLDAVEQRGRLEPRITPADHDEFAAASEGETDRDDENEEDGFRPEAYPDAIDRAIATRAMDGGRPLHVDLSTSQVLDRAGEGTTAFSAHDGRRCGACFAEPKKQSLLRPFRFGAPFLIGNAAPVMLDGVPPAKLSAQTAHRPPAEGRQLLSFTDSRQGTARFAASLQTNAERNFVRGFLYHSVQGSMTVDAEDPALAQLQAEIAQLEIIAKTAPGVGDFLNDKKAELARKAAPSTAGLPWKTLRSDLAARPEVYHWMKQVWGYRHDRYRDDPTAFAEFLLLRELARRARRANTAETLGLVRLRFDAIDRIAPDRLPAELKARDRTIEEWRDFLSILVDQVARNNFAARIARDDAHWLSGAQILKTLLPPREKKQAKTEQGWPMVGEAGSVGNAAIILEKTLGLDRSDRQGRAILNDVLETAWDQLQPLFVSPTHGDYALDFGKAHIAPVIQAWECPVTRRVLGATGFGLSPYGHHQGLKTADLPARPITMPRLPIAFPRGDAQETLRAWTEGDSAVAELREQGIWRDIHDRVALLSPYLRAAEHSAQQPAARLRRFEGEFKAGEINILNCSTTMEMGVDIGSVSAVMMTNVPPALANYRQRVGRAGRRGQGWASALTYTRDTPLDREAFCDPVTYLTRPTRAPRVKLDSRRIVQRHVNALLLARWFAGEGGEALKTQASAFFGLPAVLGAEREAGAPVTACLTWIEAESTATAMAREIAQLTRGTVLEGDRSVAAETASALRLAAEALGREWQALQEQGQQVDKAAAAGIGYQLQRLCGENLLGELASRAVLPGHGFPTDVVAFVNRDKPSADEVDAEGERQRRRAYPTRNLDIAIRDYAPGAEVVVDGLVYRSAGVTLNWTRPVDDAAVNQIQSIKRFWRCPQCGAADASHSEPAHCSSCHTDLGPNDIRRYLQPAGFTVDTAEPVHAETDLVSYVEPEREQVVARGAAWQGFAEPALGRMRATHEGLVFYSSKGPNKSGYWLCLECGRAAPEGEGSDRPLLGHRPLRFTRKGGDGLCPGNDKPFKILPPIALGHEVLTDVSEIQPAQLEQEGAAWALVSALREVLCRRLGIETGEIGMSVQPTMTPLGQRTHSLFLYDRNAGGAGFAPQALAGFETLLAGAVQILDCRQEGCVRGCSACVLTADLYKQQEIIDRRAALAFVLEMRAGLADPAEEDRADPVAVLSRHVGDEIAAMLDIGARSVTVWAGDIIDTTVLGDPGLLRLARRIADRGGVLDLVVEVAAIDGLDPASRLALRDAALAAPFKLRTGNAPRFANGATAIAAAGCDPATIWVSRDVAAARLGEGWGIPHGEAIVRFDIARLPLAASIDLGTLLPKSGTRFFEIGAELDGTIAGFGSAFAKRLLPEIRQQMMARAGNLRQIDYADRYLHAPLPVRLVLEAIAALRDALAPAGAQLSVEILTDPLKANDRQPYRPTHNWVHAQDRDAVFEGLATTLGLDLSVVESGAPHGRTLTLHFDEGAVRIVLDQGFGAWETPHFAKFDFNVDGDAQAIKLGTYSAMIASKGARYVVVTQ